MNESLRKKLVFMTLPLALAYATYSLMSKKPAPTANLQPATAAVTPIVAAGLGGSNTPATPIDRQALLAEPWGRDPFRFGYHSLPQSQSVATSKTKQQAQASPQVGWAVSGILYSDSKPVAYVNRKAVVVGDMVDNARVIAITKTSVTLEYAGKRMTISPH